MTEFTGEFHALLACRDVAGSDSQLARDLGVPQATMWRWVNQSKRLPAEYVLKAEQLYAVSRHELRPDIYPVEGPAAHGDEAAEFRLRAERIYFYRKGIERGLHLSVIDRQVQPDPDAVCQPLEMVGGSRPTPVTEDRHKGLRLLRSLLANLGRVFRQGRDQRDQHVVQRIDPILKGDVHCDAPLSSPQLGDDEDVIAARIFAHRLSENSK